MISALFGYVCVRHTRIFFGILTLALSQVLWSLAFKFFWVTGGTDGIRVPRSSITLLGGLLDFKGAGAYPRFVYAYYYYVLVVFAGRGGDHVGDRAFALRQGAAGNSRQRDPRQLRRHPGAALSLDRLRHIRAPSRALPARFGCRSTGLPRPRSSTGRSPARSCS